MVLSLAAMLFTFSPLGRSDYTYTKNEKLGVQSLAQGHLYLAVRNWELNH